MINWQKDKVDIPFASRIELVLIIALGCVNIALVALISSLFSLEAVFVAIAVAVLYLAEIALIMTRRSATAKIAPNKSIHALLKEDGSTVIQKTAQPVIAFDYYGTVLWYNDAMREVIGPDLNFISTDIGNVFNIDPAQASSGEVINVTLFDRLFTLESFRVSEDNGGLYIAMLSDVTELAKTKKNYFDERISVAYIAIDNVEEVLQYVHEKFADAVSRIDDKLKAWAASIGGILKSYDSDKYIMLLDSVQLDKCIEDRFAILDDIRDTRIGDGMSITVSIGVARVGGSLADREMAARDAIDMALQRGGDQAVYKSETETVFYGGRTKTVYRRSNVHSRAFASQLTALIARADNVIIMGHRYGDFDSFGAAIGIARLAMLCGVKANIAVDLRDKNLLPCIEMMQKTETYSQIFVDNAGGLDLISPDTLVVLVDHSQPLRAQFSDIANKSRNIAVIDHHRKIVDLPDTVKLSYIDPSASSASELVTEMLESSVSSQTLMKEEADLLLAGILLDTKQFTRNTGTRTFGAAQYLRGAGANPTDVYSLFKTTPEDLSKEAHFHTAITIYRENIAISCCDGETDESYRVIASKAADKMLTLRGVEAAFTMVRIGDQIHISGRSSGKINVQLILEKLHGGGHFDVAGAQVSSSSVVAVLDTLKSSIDEYLDA